MGFKDKHLLGIEPMRPEAIVEILDLAENYVQLNRSQNKRAESLTGLTQINMFFENSTRTQASFELAGKRLGANVMSLSMEASSLKKGETLELGKLLIIMGECRYPLANPSGDAFTFLKVVGDGGAKEIFRGWMIASSPAVSAIDHVRYDVWPIRCVTSDAVAE